MSPIASLVRLEPLNDAEWEVDRLGMFHPGLTLRRIRQTFPFASADLNEKLVFGLEMAVLE